MQKDDFLKELGFAIKMKRMRQKISQEKLAELADCSLSYICFVKKKKKSISLYNFLKVAAALDLEVGDFLKKFLLNSSS